MLYKERKGCDIRERFSLVEKIRQEKLNIIPKTALERMIHFRGLTISKLSENPLSFISN